MSTMLNGKRDIGVKPPDARSCPEESEFSGSMLSQAFVELKVRRNQAC